jgi:hypothetical protein
MSAPMLCGYEALRPAAGVNARASLMGKRKIDAKQALIDIRAGYSDPELMEKYDLTAQGLDSLFGKLIAANLLTQDELDNRMPLAERTVSFDVHRCPACGMPQLESFDVCPQCGVIVSKFQDQKRAIKKSAQGVTYRDLVNVSIRIPRELQRKLSLMRGDPSTHIAEAIELYLKTKKY